MGNRLFQALALVLLCAALVAVADTEKPRLKMFGDEPNPHGLWKTELLEASDPALMANAKRMSEMAVCMDAGLEKGKDVKPSESACTRAVLKNTSSESQIETKCPERPTTVTTMKYVLVPSEKVDLRQNLGRKVEVTAVLIPAGDDRAKIETKTKTEVNGKRSQDIETKEKVPQGPMAQLRVISMKQVAGHCSE